MNRILLQGNRGKGNILSYTEAKWLWRNGNGTTITVDGRELSAWDIGGEFASPYPYIDNLKVHGQVLTNPNNGRIFDGPYDFEPRVMANPNQNCNT